MNIKSTYRCALFLTMAGLSSLSFAGESVSLQAGADRMGSDYKSITLDIADPQICRQACADDGVCKSYTYVKPGVKGANAVCFLKSSVVPAVADACCTSGAKTITLASIPAATSKNPSLKIVNNPMSAADPQQLLKAVNDLKAQNAAQQETINELKSLVAQARDEIQALKAYDEIAKGGIAYINSSQQSFQNKFKEFKTKEYDQHYHEVNGIVGNAIGESEEVLLKKNPVKVSGIPKPTHPTGKPIVKD